MKFVLMSNNPLVRDSYSGKYEVCFVDGSYMDVLIATRDRCHAGCRLLSHPLSGSVKPNETLYKSVMISKDAGSVDFDSVIMIEDAITTAAKFGPVRRNWREQECRDFQLVDLTLIVSAIESAENSMAQ